MAQKAIVSRNCYPEWHARQRSGRQRLFIPSWDGRVAGMRDAKVVVGQECRAEAQRSSRGCVFTSSRSHAVCGLAETGLGGGSGSADVGATGLRRVGRIRGTQAEWSRARMAEWQSGRVAEWQSGRVAEWQSGRVATAASSPREVWWPTSRSSEVGGGRRYTARVPRPSFLHHLPPPMPMQPSAP
jgi:hypothetical protein